MTVRDYWQNKHLIAPLKCAVLLDLAFLGFIPRPCHGIISMHHVTQCVRYLKSATKICAMCHVA